MVASERFYSSAIPDAIALELESQDEYFVWSEDGTHLISEDGEKTLPAQSDNQPRAIKRNQAISEKYLKSNFTQHAQDLEGKSLPPTARLVKFLSFDKNSLGILLSIVNLILLLGFWLKFSGLER